jgi:hypothetical protein
MSFLDVTTPEEWNAAFEATKHGGNVVGHKRGDAVVKDMVEKPEHYHQGAIECIEYIKGQLTEEQYKGYLAGSLYKYVHRFQYKNGNEDLRKAQWFLKRLTELEEVDG